MLTLGNYLKFYCYLNRVDMRKGYNGLSGIIQEHYEKNPKKEHLKSKNNSIRRKKNKRSVFISKQKSIAYKHLKLIYIEKYIEEQRKYVLPKNLIGKAFFYTKNIFSNIKNYLKGGIYQIDNHLI